MRYLPIFTLLLISCGQTKDSVDESDRLDLTNTVDTTKGTYHPKIDTTYFFPGDSSDIVSTYQHSDYKIKTILFPVKYKYVILFLENAGNRAKIKNRDYKLQIEISNNKGLFIKKVITKDDFFELVLRTDKNYYFIRDVLFKGLANDELRIFKQ